MIGVVSAQTEAVVSEFFELFKTPWEYCRPGARYSVVLSTEGRGDLPEADLVILSTAETTAWDRMAGIQTAPSPPNCRLDFSGDLLPVFGPSACFSGQFAPVLNNADTGGIMVFDQSGGTAGILRIGYDIFDQIRHLLTSGLQPGAAGLPAAEMHIDILRQGLIRRGIPFVEIPPVPAGKSFVACLTHDVDFHRIIDHRFDHTFFGFVYRAAFGELLKAMRGRGSLKKMILNWLALLKLPFVFLGLAPDIWTRFAQYARLEKHFGATYFFIPHKMQPGDHPAGGQAPPGRAARYDVADIRNEIRSLERQGFEIGLHGIDAWRSPAAGRREADRLARFTRMPIIGARMHWLYLDDGSHEALEAAGFSYDSTVGFNDGAGFKSGTAQVYRPPGVSRLLELPMILQDSALFYPDRMNLSEREAGALVNGLVEKLKRYGGCLTINWHHRSIAPERLWGDFYKKMLGILARQGAWFGNARTVVDWFDKRRRTQFKAVHFASAGLRVVIEGPDQPPADLTLRIYHPVFYGKSGDRALPFLDIAFSGRLDTTMRLADMAGGAALAT